MVFPQITEDSILDNISTLVSLKHSGRCLLRTACTEFATVKRKTQASWSNTWLSVLQLVSRYFSTSEITWITDAKLFLKQTIDMLMLMITRIPIMNNSCARVFNRCFLECAVFELNMWSRVFVLQKDTAEETVNKTPTTTGRLKHIPMFGIPM